MLQVAAPYMGWKTSGTICVSTLSLRSSLRVTGIVGPRPRRPLNVPRARADARTLLWRKPLQHWISLVPKWACMLMTALYVVDCSALRGLRSRKSLKTYALGPSPSIGRTTSPGRYSPEAISISTLSSRPPRPKWKSTLRACKRF